MRRASIKDHSIKDETPPIVSSYNCFSFNAEYPIFKCGHWQKSRVRVESLTKGVKRENVAIMYLYLSHVLQCLIKDYWIVSVYKTIVRVGRKKTKARDICRCDRFHGRVMHALQKNILSSFLLDYDISLKDCSG